MIYKRKGRWHLDVTMAGVRYREALDTTDRREAKEREKDRIAAIKQGKGASKTGREFARKPFNEAASVYLEERKPHVAARTLQIETERLRPLRRHFGARQVSQLKAEDISAYQTVRLKACVSNRTVNMEVGVVRRMLKRAKVWNALAEDVKSLPETQGAVGKALPSDVKLRLFETAGSKPAWMAAHCAAVLSVSTTCRSIEIKNLRWCDIDLFNQDAMIRRSKTAAGHRTVPLNGDAMAALARLLERARLNGSDAPEHFVFPACENMKIDPTRHQKSWRSAWRSLRQETARRAGRDAAKEALEAGRRLRAAIAAYKRAQAALMKFRFHDLRHQAITEMAELGASEATLTALAGHMSRRMMELYSHVRMEAKRSVVEQLGGGLMSATPREAKFASQKVN